MLTGLIFDVNLFMPVKYVILRPQTNKKRILKTQKSMFVALSVGIARRARAFGITFESVKVQNELRCLRIVVCTAKRKLLQIIQHYEKKSEKKMLKPLTKFYLFAPDISELRKSLDVCMNDFLFWRLLLFCV